MSCRRDSLPSRERQIIREDRQREGIFMRLSRKAALVASAVIVGVAGVGGAAWAVLPDNHQVCADNETGALALKADADLSKSGVQCPSGSTFVDLQGPAGPKGDTGEAGPVGPKGDTGETGPVGPKGDAGEVGPAGPKGDTGAQGEAGSILAGYVQVKGVAFTATVADAYTVRALCPTPEHDVIGGGFSSSRGVVVRSSRPGDGQWVVTANLKDGQTLRAWAVCAVPAA